MHLHSCTLILLGILFFASAHATVELYVSPQGRENTKDVKGTLDDPLTLVGARDRIRDIKKEGGGDKGQFVVYLRSGKYFLEDPFVLESIDSGKPDAPIKYL